MTQDAPHPDQTAPLPYWPPHKPRHLTLPATGLHHNLEVSAARYPQRTALWFYGQGTSYADLFMQAARLSGHLARRGVQRGDRVLIWTQNSPAWAIAAHAIWRLGAVVVPLAPMLQARELAFFLADAGIKTGVVGAELYSRAREAGLAHAVVVNVMAGVERSPVAVPDGLDVQATPEGTDASWEAALFGEAAPVADVGPDDLAVMPYTSGTTGLPKGCMHTHGSVQANIFGAGVWVDTNVEDVFLATLPFFHVTGFVNSLMGPLSMGATCVIMARWDRETARTLIRERGVTLWTNTATMVIDLLNSPHLRAEDLASVRDVTGGGASLPRAVGERLQTLTGITFVEGYGLSETMAQTHTNPAERAKFQCLGIPLFDVDARVVDVDHQREVARGETGEIVLRGPQVFQGSCNRPQAPAEAFTELDGARYFRTGDLGYVDDEGYFFFVDRLKRMVNVSGLKVWPAEVENHLHAHPAVQEACVIAVPDERSGEHARALVVLRAGQTLSAEDLITWARGEMAHYKVPREVVFVDSLPRSPTGKVAWRPLQEAARAGMNAGQQPT